MTEKRWNRGCALLSAIALGLVWLSSPSAWAAELMRPLQWMQVENMSFISGGVGMRERRELFDLVDKYDALFSFAQRDSGQFLTNVRVDLARRGSDEPQVSLQSAGPYMFAQLPEGKYQLTASAPGLDSYASQFEVRADHQQRVYVTLEKSAMEPSLAVSLQ